MHDNYTLYLLSIQGGTRYVPFNSKSAFVCELYQNSQNDEKLQDMLFKG